MARTAKVATSDMNIYDKVDMKNIIEASIDDTVFDAKLTKEDKAELIRMCGHKKTVSFLVDQYYQSQAFRITCQNQMRSLMQGYDEAEIEHPQFLKKELTNALLQESINKKYMDIITNNIPICTWMKSIYGIGPVFSAYLYSVFDIERGRYASEFLSYAGLNDNRNPWLGEAKATAMVKDVLEWRDKEKIEPLDLKIQEICGNKSNYAKFKSQIKKLFKLTSEVYCADIIRLSREIGIESERLEQLEILFSDYSLEFDEWCNLQAHPDYVGDIVFGKVAQLTTRKPDSIKRCTINIKTKKKGKVKEYPNAEYLKSYLARPPYNLELKKKCFLIGESFMKQSNREGSLYGRIYKQRKLEETFKNDRGDYAKDAKRILESKDWSKDTETKKALLEGRLSAGHINMRAKRYAVKLFISHVFEAMYYDRYRETPPNPYVIEYMGHHDYIAPEIDYRLFLD